MGSDTSPHVLRFSTGFDHRRERRRLEYAFLTNAAATVRSVLERWDSECVCEAPTFSCTFHGVFRMVVPT